MTFAQEMLDTKKKLEEAGHEVKIPHETAQHVTNPSIVSDEHATLQWVLENDAMRIGFENVAWSDAVLVLNHDKNNTQGYIGISTIMEMGVGFFLKKKLFLLNAVPHWDTARWAHEIAMLQPTIINGDLNKIQ